MEYLLATLSDWLARFLSFFRCSFLSFGSVKSSGTSSPLTLGIDFATVARQLISTWKVDSGFLIERRIRGEQNDVSTAGVSTLVHEYCITRFGKKLLNHEIRSRHGSFHFSSRRGDGRFSYRLYTYADN